MRDPGAGRGGRWPAGGGARRRHRGLVDGHDIEDWADALDGLLRLGSGPRGWAMRKAAVGHASNFSWERTVDAQLASYSRAIEDFAAARRTGPRC